MRKVLVLLFVMAAALAMVGMKGTLASGDKVRGDEGVGSINQEMNQDPQCWDTSWCEPK